MKRISTYLDDVSRQVENFHVSVAVTRLHRVPGERCAREANSNSLHTRAARETVDEEAAGFATRGQKQH